MSPFETAEDRVTVDVWSDVMCPFCLIGDTLLDQAADAAEHPVDIRYHSFQLQPDLPADRPQPVLDMLVAAKGITREQAEQIAKTKQPDLTAADLDAAVRTIAGSARSMGITVEGV